ncbi:hypothetical protein B0H19DRAFT_1277126 [Mycena capillaripes]|nr:hypothetical protein B0H19DRAFT_1277126 [Mycena capillaripes]
MKSFILLVFLMHLSLTATTLVAAAPLDHIPAVGRDIAEKRAEWMPFRYSDDKSNV